MTNSVKIPKTQPTAVKESFLAASVIELATGESFIIYKVDLANPMEPTSVDQDDEILIITILLIAHRREIYR